MQDFSSYLDLENFKRLDGELKVYSGRMYIRFNDYSLDQEYYIISS